MHSNVIKKTKTDGKNQNKHFKWIHFLSMKF